MVKNVGISLIAGFLSLYAQTDSSAADENKWKVDINSNVALSWNYYGDNWTGDELSSFAWTAQFNTVLEKQLVKILNNKNTFKLSYGQTKQQHKDSTGEREWLDFEKSTDLIDLESLLRFTLNEFVDPYIGFRLISQFYDARDTLQARTVNPVELTESFGAARSIVKDDNVTWDARLAGAARQTVDRFKDREDWTTHDGGLEFVTGFKATNKDNWWTFTSDFKLYEALFSSKSDTDTTSNWRYPDINWENSLTINLHKYIMLNWYMQLLYDKEVDVNPKTGELDSGARFKNTLSLGLTFNYKNY